VFHRRREECRGCQRLEGCDRTVGRIAALKEIGLHVVAKCNNISRLFNVARSEFHRVGAVPEKVRLPVSVLTRAKFCLKIGAVFVILFA